MNLINTLLSTISSVLMILGFLMVLAVFMTFHSGGFPRKARYVTKKFAILPTILSTNNIIWLKTYFSYRTYGHGVSLGGTTDTIYSDNKKYVHFHSRGSFFPHTRTEWKGLSQFELRKYLRQDEYYKSKYHQKVLQIKNIKKMADFFNQEKK